MAEKRAQRRLAAVLAADVVGYSRMMERDESATLTSLKTLRKNVFDPLVERYQGRVFKVIGDGVLVEFSSAVNALQCAIELQQSVAAANSDVSEFHRIVLRVGINLGDVLVEGSDLYGDGVNIAARLEGIADPGGIVISGPAFDQVRNKVSATFEDLGAKALKNLAEPVRVYRVRASAESGLIPAGQEVLPLPTKPSIAVLPFQNMSGDPEQEYFADGIVEEIITALSRIRWLFVIARNSSFTYKGRAIDVKQVGRELGVRYVLEGSVRKAGNRVRITGQLIDVSTGAHIWADRFEGELANIFDLQDQVTGSVVGTIEPKLEQAEMERAKRKPTESLDAYDHYLRGLAGVHQWTREGNNEALRQFKRAIELDPDFATAYGMAARCYSQRIGFAWVIDRSQEVADADRLARRAGELGKDDAIALCTAGNALVIFVGDINDGSALIDRALKLNPNLAFAWMSSGFARILLGEPQAAIEHVTRAMRLSPQDPQMFAMEIVVAAAQLFSGRPEEAFRWAEKATQERPNFFVGQCFVAASGGLAGKHSEAAKALNRARLLNPALRIATLSDLQPFRRPEHLARLADGLRQVGLPE